MSNLAWRILVAVIGIPLLMFCIVSGGSPLKFLIVLLQVAALWEWKKISESARIPFASYLLLFPLAAVDLSLFVSDRMWSGAVATALVFFWILSSVFDGARKPLQTLGHGALFVLYAALPLVLWLPISEIDSGARLSVAGSLFVLFAATWLCDSAAYFGGRAFGKHKLYEKASPNKTIEGAFFGLVGAAILLPAMRVFGFASPTFLDYLMLPLIVGVAGQAGDLIESLMKREAGVKDSSGLIPGHGGVLDRFDSLLLSTPFYFAYLFLTK